MTNTFGGIFKAPEFSGEEEARTAGLLNVTLLTLVALTFFVPLFIAILESDLLTLVIGLSVASLFFVLWLLMRRGYLRIVSWLTSLVLLISLTASAYLFSGISDSSIIAFPLVILLAGLLLGDQRAVIAFTAGAVGAVALVYVLETQGIIQYALEPAGPDDLLVISGVFIVIGALLGYAMRRLREAILRARASEQALAAANEELGKLNEVLESRVVERTRALELSASISRRLSTILDPQELIEAVVNQLQQTFDYYHVHVYLLDEWGTELRMVGGTGEPAKTMLENNHTVMVGHGLVGRAVETNYPVLVPDVFMEADWLPNPLLPDTRSEAAVPIARGEEVLGVLDVQEDEVGALDDEDIELLRSIGNQMAVGLQNAHLFREAQRRADEEALLNAINQRIQNTVTVNDAMQVAVRELGRALNGQQATVRFDRAGIRGGGR